MSIEYGSNRMNRPSRRILVVALVGAIIAIAALVWAVGLVLGWGPVTSAHWGILERGLAVALALIVAAIMGFASAGIVRQCVLGLPAARFEPEGLRIGSTLVRWSDIGSVTRFDLVGEPCLGFDAPADTLRPLRRIDRLVAELNVRGGLPRVVLTSGQLADPVDEVIRRLETRHAASAESL